MMEQTMIPFLRHLRVNAAGVINRLDFNGLAALKTAINPIKLAVEVLSCEDANFSIADNIIAFMLLKLADVENTIR